MPSVITLDIFSGRENPSWVVDDDKIRDLQRIAAGGTSVGVVPLLGYRGFRVRPVGAPPTAAPRMHGMPESAPGAGDAVIAGLREAEEFLLSTAAEHIDARLRAYAREAIARGPDMAAVRAAAAAAAVQCPKCDAADAPDYNPNSWNTEPTQRDNNCYNYANNKVTNTFAQPGRATGHPIGSVTCTNVQSAATSDGLQACTNCTDKLGPGKGWYVALVVSVLDDYHWYRQDKVGCWSHKIETGPARNTDQKGAIITDPKTCARGDYTTWCTYMITTHNVRIG